MNDRFNSVDQYGIRHDGDLYRFEAQARRIADDTGALVWMTRVVETSTIDDDDGDGSFHRRSHHEQIAPWRPVTTHISTTNLRTVLVTALLERNFSPLSGETFTRDPKDPHQWNTPLALPIVEDTPVAAEAALMVRVAARLGTTLMLRDLDEARKATTWRHRNDPAVLAVMISHRTPAQVYASR